MATKTVRHSTNKIPAASAALRKLWADPVWAADLVARRKEAIAKAKAEGRTSSRFGIRNGSNKQLAERAWVRSRKKAQKTMEELKAAGALPDDEAAVEAMTAALEVMRGPTNQKIKMQAINTILRYTKAPPATKHNVTLNAAEEWLKAISEGGSDDGSEGAEDA